MRKIKRIISLIIIFALISVSSSVAARLYNLPFDGIATEQRFTDLPLYSSYADAVEFLARFGVVSGDGTGMFYENERITIVDAVKILTLIAGYKTVADQNGGYPEGYLFAARQAGLLKGVDNAEGLMTGKSMVFLIANMLNADALDITRSGEWVSVESADQNILKRMFDVDVVEGVVTQNSLTAFSSSSDLADHSVEITAKDGKHILYTEEYGKYLGCNIRAYYRSDSDQDSIVYAYPLRNEVKTLNIRDIALASSSRSEVNYYDSEKDKNKKLSGSEFPTVIYNYTYYAEGDLDRAAFYELLKDKKGTVELIDNDSDGRFDVMNILAYDSFIVGNVMLDEAKVYSSSNNFGKQTDSMPYKVVDIDPENYEYFSMRFDDGTEASILDIVQNHIMSVAQSSPSASKKAIDIIISRNIQSGTVASISDDANGGKIIALDSREPLKVTKDVVDNFELKVGKYVSFYIDAFGNVIGASLLDTGFYRYGVMLGYEEKNYTISLKLFTADNKVETFELVKNAYIDGKRYKDYKAQESRLVEILRYINESQKISIESDPIKAGIFPLRYQLNDEGKLIRLDTPAKDKWDSEEDGLMMGESGSFAALYDYVLCEYNVSKPKIIPVSKSATVIELELNGELMSGDRYSYDASEYDETSIDIYSVSSFLSGVSERECYTYRLNSGANPASPYVDLILSVDRSSVASDAYMLMVDGIEEIYDEKEASTLPMLTGISQGGRKELPVASIFLQEFESMNLKKGDTVRYAVDKLGYLSDVSMISHYMNDATTGEEVADITDNYNGIQINATNHKRWLFIGYVVERQGELVKIQYKGKGQYPLKAEDIDVTVTDGIVYTHPNASTAVTVYDRKEDRVFVGTFDDIKDYIHYGENASRVIVRYDSGSLKEIIVYND